MPTSSPRVRAARKRAGKRWYVYLILCHSGTIYTGIALDVVVRYAQHVAGTGARYTRANPPRRLLAKFACPNQSVAGKLEAAIKKLAAIEKKELVGKTGAEVRKALFGDRPLRAS
jgi:putative endonuclease